MRAPAGLPGRPPRHGLARAVREGALQGDPQGNREQVGGEDEHALTGDGVGPAGGDGEVGQLGGQRLQRVLGAEREQVVQSGRQRGDRALVDLAARGEGGGEGARHLGRGHHQAHLDPGVGGRGSSGGVAPHPSSVGARHGVPAHPPRVDAVRRASRCSPGVPPA